MIRKTTFFDYANFKLYLESVVGLTQEQAQTVFTSSFELGRITMIIGFLIGLFMGAAIL